MQIGFSGKFCVLSIITDGPILAIPAVGHGLRELRVSHFHPPHLHSSRPHFVVLQLAPSDVDLVCLFIVSIPAPPPTTLSAHGGGVLPISFIPIVCRIGRSVSAHGIEEL